MSRNIYIGKQSIRLLTGQAVVYNRETDQIEVMKLSEKQTLPINARKLAEETEGEYIQKEERAMREFVNPLYISYKEPYRELYKDVILTEAEMRGIYNSDADKSKYSDFREWLSNMLNSHVFEKV